MAETTIHDTPQRIALDLYRNLVSASLTEHAQQSGNASPDLTVDDHLKLYRRCFHAMYGFETDKDGNPKQQSKPDSTLGK